MKKDILFHDESVFSNPEVFDFDFVPEEFLFRDSEIKELANCINPAVNKKRPVNCMLSGPPATGKTTSIKKIFEEINGYSHIIKVYINGRVHNTNFRVFSEIHRSIFKYTPPESGVAVTTLYQKICEGLKSENKILLIAIDDCIFLEEADEIIYELSRANEIYPGIKIGIIAVLNEKEKYIIEEKSSSVFCPCVIEYFPYTEDEIFEILKLRAKFGFYPGVISEELLKIIAEHSIDYDLRFGIELLRQSAIECENKSMKTITKEHIEKAYSRILKSDKPGKVIDEKEKIILGILNVKKYESGELYLLVKKKLDVSYSSFYRILDKLEKKKLITVIEKATNKGRTRVISKN
ncbi:MAG: ORC1-type DNA replication protein [Nanoarchaeota archaeon]|nr:ORC1-type DNA replication protein [Nanoarchaeota archaeon]